MSAEANPIQGSAAFSEVCGHRFRHRLDRWRAEGPRALVVMANPSRAGADANDPTIARLNALLLSMFAGYTVVNWSPYVATDPTDLHRWRDQFSRSNPAEYKRLHAENLALVRQLSAESPLRIIAWGSLVPRVPHTTQLIAAASLDYTVPLHCLGTTKDGSPKHPMARGKHRIPDGTVPALWLDAHQGGTDVRDR